MSSQPPPPAYPPAGYPPAGPPQGPRTSNQAVIALVLAVGSWVVCPLVLAVVALVVASNADREIAASGGWVTGDGLVTAARVVSWINIGITAAVVVGIALLLLVAGITSSSVST